MVMSKRHARKKQFLPKTPQQYVLTILIGLMLWGTFWLTESFAPVRLPQSDKPIELYSNQLKDDLSGTIVTAIQEAKHSVLLVIYALTDERVIQALREKSDEGIEVKVICDAKASPNMVQRLGPNIQLLRRFSAGIMHQKILVIDGLKTWIGSANMTKESLKLHGNLIAALYCPELAAMLQKKAGTMTEYDEGPRFETQEFVVAGQHLEMWLLPDNRLAAKRIVDLIRSAEKTIRVAMFTWTRADFSKAIIEAHQRGVDVQVAIDHYSAKGASAKVVQWLAQGGFPVYLSPGGGALLHHKFLYIDGKTLVNGSANWTKAAFTKNEDCFIVLHDLIPSQKLQLDQLWDVITTEATLVK